LITENILIAPCGLHCGFCLLYKALDDEKLKKLLIERLNLPSEKATCTGCRSVDGYCPVIGEQCATWICSRQKEVEFCHECSEFPCIKLMPCADRADKIPHNLKTYSLTFMKIKGMREWNRAIKEIYDLYYRGQIVIGRGPRPRV
jgi:hypothetical protein